jgi:hypothetical protein
MVSVQARHEQVRLACSRGLSQRRACTLLNVSRSGMRYKHTKLATDAPVLAQMKVLALCAIPATVIVGSASLWQGKDSP